MWTACVAGGVARTSCVSPWVRFQLLPVFFKVFSSSLPSRHHVAPCWSFQPPPHGRMFFLMYVGCVCRRGGGPNLMCVSLGPISTFASFFQGLLFFPLTPDTPPSSPSCWSFRMFFLMYVGCVCRRGSGDSSWWSAWSCRFLLMVNHLVLETIVQC